MADDWPQVGTRLAFRYRLAAQIEQGGMAVVWRAHDELLDREVAVKLLSGDVVGNAGLFDLVRREARASAKLSHPNVTAVHDYAEAVRPDGAVAPFVVMELLDGETLAARLHRGPMRWAEAAGIVAQVGRALEAAHSGGVVHRDVTPGNVMLTSSTVKVVDFGISAAIGEPDEDGSGATFGTPAYVAPERLDGLPALPATDVYGLGCLLFEMVSGQPPYPVDTWEELVEARTRPPGELPADLPSAYAHLVRWCLAEQPADRPSADQVARLLTELTRSSHPLPIEAAAPARTAGRRAPRLPRRRPGSKQSRTMAAARQGGLLIVTAGLVTLGAVAAGTPFARSMPTRSTAVPALAGPPSDTTARSARSAVAPTLRPTVDPGPFSVRSAPVAPTVSAPVHGTGRGPTHGTGRSATPPPARPPASRQASTSPTVAPTTGPDEGSDATPGGVEPPDVISVGVAVERLADAVDVGLSAGEIRADVAHDLLNVIDTLGRSGQPDLAATILGLRRKVSDRQREGGVSAAAAATLQDRLSDLSTSAAV